MNEVCRTKCREDCALAGLRGAGVDRVVKIPHRALLSILGSAALSQLQVHAAPAVVGLDAFPRPKVLDESLSLELLAAEPDLATPVGCAVDRKGRIFVVQSNTHFPNANYPGPKTDRVLRFPGSKGGKPVVVAEGFRWAMNLVLDRANHLYLTHRNGVVRFDESPADGSLSRQTQVVTLETSGDYPHNGLGGIAIGQDGSLVFGVGENLGAAYTVVGSDGARIAVPAGAGGRVFRCRADGSHPELLAVGFWNPFGLEFDRAGRLWTVDNDPDSRPPCRLLHVIPGGDYGFQFRHGRDGLSPFIAWDGELPGTLPMAAGTGEAPTSVIDASRTSLPSKYGTALLVASAWEHAIEFYRLSPVGISFKSTREVLVEGGEDFRPVAMTVAPDGSVVFTDWVKQDYNVHSHGRLWRLSAREGSKSQRGRNGAIARSSAEREVEKALKASASNADESLRKLLRSSDPFARSLAVSRLAERSPAELEKWVQASGDPMERQQSLVALRRAIAAQTQSAGQWNALRDSMVRSALQHADAGVRLVAITWVVEENVESLRPAVSASINAGPVTPLSLAAHAEALKRWRGSGEVVSEGATNSVRWIRLHASNPDAVPQALKQLSDPLEPTHRKRDALRVISGRHETNVVEAMRRVALDRSADPQLRADAVLGLTGGHEDHVSDLLSLLREGTPAGPAPVAVEMTRALRPWLAKPGVRPALESLNASGVLGDAVAFTLGRGAARPTTEAGWLAALAEGTGDWESGRRIFNSGTAACAKCHRIEGVGGTVGPDLSTIARGANREKMLRALLDPSRDIAPQFAQYQFETKDGESYTGRILSEAADAVTVVTGEGQAVILPKRLIASQEILKLSIMPEGLLDGMSVGEVRDLIGYLETRR